ncbi:polysaccharide biosynthesis protein EpsC [Gordoniibacillus kamchatkensis]|uniref:Polysaccharide biosynthesis protein EpsC n=1 Tax=Gordoniibacillus kamchatkensis TaxID=1590651 RepID=A0ABR5AGH8_9BACL|nr:nucleoside-diphosphate sugar epimerase/dehydratase [Paenibacillus sp. VKM B-2647]KIL40136.1 polysaccharide biosynthesis protein EpsC [Paenibacillus sp. VKM B-2647]
MTYQKRLFFLMLLDSIIVLTSIYMCNIILIPSRNIFTPALLVSSVSLLICHHVFAHLYKLYKRVWRYSSIGELVAIIKAITASIAITSVLQQVLYDDVYVRVMAITWMMHLILIGGIRFSWRILRDRRSPRTNFGNKKQALIIGAGSAGMMIARQLKYNPNTDLYPFAFIDDDTKKHKLEVLGLPVLGGREKIEEVAKEHNISNIIIAIPSLNKKELRQIVEECNKTRAKTQIVPMLEHLITGKIKISEVRDVQVEDLLGREPVELDTFSIAHYLTGNTILVTGAGGSIGSEICRQVSRFSPLRMILLGHGENSIYSIEMELKSSNTHNVEYFTEIADIQDRDKIYKIMEKYRPGVVFHAAAHKHVPLMERNPEEAIKNNVIGTKNVAEAADRYGVDTFVMISTDKAVNPTSVMGATKRLAEMIIQDLDRRSTTKFVAVRFGNVLGSRGSVIPLFKEQIRRGGPVTVTHPDMVRYFMTIPEASRLVLQAGALAQGGEIFVLDMGEPVKIVDLAKNLIRLSGYTEEEIGIEFTGMRPGEKLFEELLGENEVHEDQVYPKIYVGKSAENRVMFIERLIDLVNNYPQPSELRQEIMNIVFNRKQQEEKLVTIEA